MKQKIKQITALLFLAAMTFTLAACGSSGISESIPESAPENETASGSTQIANPYTECETLEQAAELAGFSLSLPESAADYPDRAYRAIEGEMIEVIDRGGDEEIRIRKASGSRDVSGSFNQHSESGTVEAGALRMATQGDAGLVHVATWTQGDFSFSITSTAGMTSEELVELATAIA